MADPVTTGRAVVVGRVALICAVSLLAVTGGIGLSACGHKAAGAAVKADQVADDRLVHAADEPRNWLMHGGTYSEQRYSTLDQIDTGNVGTLALAWSLELDTHRGQETTPLVVDGTAYVTTAWSKVVAMDAATGQQRWEYDPKVPPQTAVRGCCDVVSRGAAYDDGRIFAASFDGRLFALDAKTGKLLWMVATTPADRAYTITGAPRVFNGKVIIGNGGAELGVRGYVTAYDARSGKQLWRFYTVPRADGKADGEVSDEILNRAAAPTWSDGEWKTTGGGGTVWDSIVYDPELNQIYLGVGNGAPWSHLLRSGGKGDNLFLSSIVALDADTGAYRWHYQETPGESWDFTATQPIMLATLDIDGAPRKVLMQAPKNGFFYVLDRASGKLISASPFAKVTWAKCIDMDSGRPVEVEGARYEQRPFLMSPSSYGAHNWYPMSFSPRTGLVYFPVQDVPVFYAQDKDYRYRAQTFNLGMYSEKNALPTDAAKLAAIKASLTGALIAWDPVAQREVWRAPQPGPATAGTLATAGDLVFEGTPAGLFEAFDAKTGARLWKFQASTSVVGSPISYSVGGEQYVMVVSGAGGGYGLTSPFNDDQRKKPNGRVLAFKIGGKAALPAYQPPPLAPARVPADHFTAVQRDRGQRVYETTCGWCHGPGAMSSGVLPDLRRSPMLLSAGAWKTVVLDGALSARGMVSFAPTLTPDDAEAVRAYVASRAAALAAQQPSP